MIFPKILHLTCKDKYNIGNRIWIKCYNRYKEIYTDYQIILYDNNDIYNIVRVYYPEHLPLIKSIKNGAVLADIFRYLILYLKGGIYSDLDCYPLKHVEKLLSSKYYHGDIKNKTFQVLSNDEKLENRITDFHTNPCNNFLSSLGHLNIFPKMFKCQGHLFINEDTTIILGAESDKNWIAGCSGVSCEMSPFQVCQWFMISKPKQKLFKNAYLTSINNIQKKYPRTHMDILKSTGPRMLTTLVLKENSNNICILPADVFCAGSNALVPQTQNSIIRHKFTGSWR